MSRIRGARQNQRPGTIAGNLDSKARQTHEVDIRTLALALRPFLGTLTGQPQSSNPVPFSPHGFGFFIGGLMLADELLGGVIFQHSMSFSSDSQYMVVSQVPAAASAVFRIVSGTPDVQVGTITFAAGSTNGIVAWTAPPFLLSSGTQIRLRSPSHADTTLSYISGSITGAIGT